MVTVFAAFVTAKDGAGAISRHQYARLQIDLRGNWSRRCSGRGPPLIVKFMIEDAQRSPQTVTADGQLVRQNIIRDLQFKEVSNILSKSGAVTELWRPEWFGEHTRPGHVAYATMNAHEETAWHCHREQNDLLFVVRGMVRVAFYDDRENSPTYRKLNVIPFSKLRPTLVYIPAGIWHALKNTTSEEAAYVTMNDKAFNYEKPDDWRPSPGSTSLPKPF